MIRRFFTWFVILLTFCAISSAMADADPKVEDVVPLPQVRVMLGGELFEMEVATTPQTLRRGLMFREELAEHRGMIFPFRPAREVSFWMKNTLIPLDMVFTRKGKVVHVVHQALPCKADPCPTYPSVHSVDIVLEVPAGTAKRLVLKPGDPIRFLPKSAQMPKDEPATVSAEQPTETDVQKPLD